MQEPVLNQVFKVISCLVNVLIGQMQVTLCAVHAKAWYLLSIVWINSIHAELVLAIISGLHVRCNMQPFDGQAHHPKVVQGDVAIEVTTKYLPNVVDLIQLLKLTFFDWW
jgi:hypothetical protein